MSQTGDEFDDNFDILLKFVMVSVTSHVIFLEIYYIHYIFQIRNRSNNCDDISLLVDKLRQDLKSSHENASILQKEFNSELTNEKTDLNSKFVLLKGIFELLLYYSVHKNTY